MKKHLNIFIISLLSANLFGQAPKNTLESWLKQANETTINHSTLANNTINQFNSQNKTRLTYCIPDEITSPEEITSFKITSISKTLFENKSGHTAKGYEDFSSLKPVTLEATNKYTFTIEGDTKGAYYSSLTVMIDLNQDGEFKNYDFYDSNGKTTRVREFYSTKNLLYNSTGTDGKKLTFDVAIPIETTLGETRMRIAKRQTDKNNAFSVTNGCDIESVYGQVEDYTVNIVAPNPCTQVPNGPIVNELYIPEDRKMITISAKAKAGSYQDILVYKDVQYSFEVSNTNVQLGLVNTKTNKAIVNTKGNITWRADFTGVVRLYLHSDDSCTINNETVSLTSFMFSEVANPINESCNLGIPSTDFILTKELNKGEEVAIDLSAKPGKAITVSGLKINLQGDATKIDFDVLDDSNNLPNTVVSKIKGKIISKKLINTINGKPSYQYDVDFDQPVLVDAINSTTTLRKWLKLNTDAQTAELNALFTLGSKLATLNNNKWTLSSKSDVVHQIKATCAYTSCIQIVPQNPKLDTNEMPNMAAANTLILIDVVVDKNNTIQIDGIEFDYWMMATNANPTGEPNRYDIPKVNISLRNNDPEKNFPLDTKDDKDIKNIAISKIDTVYLQNQLLKYDDIIALQLEKFRAKIKFEQPLILDGKNADKYWLNIESASVTYDFSNLAENVIGEKTYYYTSFDPITNKEVWENIGTDLIYSLDIKCSKLGTSETEKLGDIKIYPNPVRDQLTIESLINIKTVEIYNMAGLRVQTKETNNKSVQLNLSNLPAGVYILKALDEKGKVTTQKIIKK